MPLARLAPRHPTAYDNARADLSCLGNSRLVTELGPVEIHRDWMTVARVWIMAAKLLSVLPARMAMRLYSLSLPK